MYCFKRVYHGKVLLIWQIKGVHAFYRYTNSKLVCCFLLDQLFWFPYDANRSR